MTRKECEEFLASCTYNRDDRNYPDDARLEAFIRGWTKATRGHTYVESTLKKLTWQNLGNRLGNHYGSASRHKMQSTFDAFAQLYKEQSEGAS
jgi:hypothetical protein